MLKFLKTNFRNICIFSSRPGRSGELKYVFYTSLDITMTKRNSHMIFTGFFAQILNFDEGGGMISRNQMKAAGLRQSMEIKLKITVCLENRCTLPKVRVFRGIQNNCNILLSIKKSSSSFHAWYDSQVKGNDIQHLYCK